MKYEFESDGGQRILVDLPMAEAPDIGEERKGPDGTIYRRVYSKPQVCGAHSGSTKWPTFESSALPRNWEYHKGEFSPDGKPRFDSRKQIDEALARENDVSEDTYTAYGEL